MTQKRSTTFLTGSAKVNSQQGEIQVRLWPANSNFRALKENSFESEARPLRLAGVTELVAYSLTADGKEQFIIGEQVCSREEYDASTIYCLERDSLYQKLRRCIIDAARSGHPVIGMTFLTAHSPAFGKDTWGKRVLPYPVALLEKSDISQGETS